MNVFDFFKMSSKKTASTAKERLQIVISHQRMDTDPEHLDFMTNLRADLIDVISKYITVEPDDISVRLQKQEQHSILELNVALPEPEGAD